MGLLWFILAFAVLVIWIITVARRVQAALPDVDHGRLDRARDRPAVHRLADLLGGAQAVAARGGGAGARRGRAAPTTGSRTTSARREPLTALSRRARTRGSATPQPSSSTYRPSPAIASPSRSKRCPPRRSVSVHARPARSSHGRRTRACAGASARLTTTRWRAAPRRRPAPRDEPAVRVVVRPARRTSHSRQSPCAQIAVGDRAQQPLVERRAGPRPAARPGPRPRKTGMCVRRPSSCPSWIQPGALERRHRRPRRRAPAPAPNVAAARGSSWFSMKRSRRSW